MNALPKTKPDDTRDRIMDVADRLFRQLGFAKTTVADIAAELDMSPANVYRFFASKNAIVEAICRRCLAELDERAWEIARSRGSAAARLERLILEILAYHKANLLTDKRVNDIVLIAIEDSWDAIEAHKEIIRGVAAVLTQVRQQVGEALRYRARRELLADAARPALEQQQVHDQLQPAHAECRQAARLRSAHSSSSFPASGASTGHWKHRP